MWYFNAWRLGTLFGGLMALLVGADYYQAPDWDYGISFWMAAATYLLMPAFDRCISRDSPHLWPLAALILYFCCDTVYVLYLYLNGMTLELRDVNLPASASLFGMCWVVWCGLPHLRNSEALSKLVQEDLDQKHP